MRNRPHFHLSPREHALLVSEVEQAVTSAPVVDIHTHLYDPAFSALLLWGLDELLVYHYLVAETFRYIEIPFQDFWSLPRNGQAELVWRHLFVEHSPVSEACRGVVTTLQAFGLDPRARDLAALRGWFESQDVNEHVTRCMELAGVSRFYMTNSPFDDEERSVWESGFKRDERFVAGLRIDPLLLGWEHAAERLAEWGYAVEGVALTKKACSAVRRFLSDWTRRIDAHYCMVSLPPDFAFPSNTATSGLLEKCILPHCREFGLPLALMPGVKRAVNPGLQLAGDGVGLTDLRALQNLCAGFPDNKFMATVLARENQHELCVLARKFRNLHIFGCWWFTNIPSLIDEITRMRVELLGLSFTPQHSDARVLDQVIYKWRHSRQVIAGVLSNAYVQLAEAGWKPSKQEIQRDVAWLLGGAFENFCGHGRR
jgi:hypothetical protein